MWREGGAGGEGTDRAGGFVDVSGAASGQGGQGGGVVYLSTEAWRRRRVGGETIERAERPGIEATQRLFRQLPKRSGGEMSPSQETCPSAYPVRLS